MQDFGQRVYCTFEQEHVPDAKQVIRWKRIGKDSHEPGVAVRSLRRIWLYERTHHGRHIVAGAMAMSPKTFFAQEESFASRALANNEASTSSWTELEKYGRRWLSMSEMNVQKASSSGD